MTKTANTPDSFDREVELARLEKSKNKIAEKLRASIAGMEIDEGKKTIQDIVGLTEAEKEQMKKE